MITGEVKSRVDAIWNAMWTGGLSNPQTVMEQLTLLLFLKGLDDAQTLAERQARARGTALERDLFPDQLDGIAIFDDGGNKIAEGRSYADLRWPRFVALPAAEMQEAAENHLIPFLRRLGSDGAPLRKHMASARYEIPTGRLLSKVVDLISDLPMKQRDTKGDLYEYMLSKVAAAGQNGQFRTPRHIINLMVAMTEPRRDDVVCDPACGTAGFLVSAAEYLRHNDADAWIDAEARQHIESRMFHGHDFDGTMLRLGAMNMALHGFEDASIAYRDSLTQEHGDEAEAYSLILANPPFAGSLDAEAVAKDLTRIVNTRKTELLFLALFLRLLKSGGRAAVVVPSGVLENDGRGHVAFRKLLLEECSLDAVITLPHFTFRPYASVATSILLFRKGFKTKKTLFFNLENDGFSSGAERSPIEGSELPQALSTYQKFMRGKEIETVRGKQEVYAYSSIKENGFDLSPRRYHKIFRAEDIGESIALSDVCSVKKGELAASSASDEGTYPFFTTSAQPKRSDNATDEGPAIIVPLVSSTGHGHASINHIHYCEGRFAAASITAVLMKRPEIPDEEFRKLYHLLRAKKNDLLVSEMRGATNTSLSLEKISQVRLPMLSKLKDPAFDKISKTEQELDELQLKMCSLRDQIADALGELEDWDGISESASDPKMKRAV
ncbi:N-6 DNA methylase [Rhodobacteraceae bacterium 2CG4]|uniref:site-specific DNA-methyltransferase (adenine-specific) n=1 Tax=Halovulum marinum TaxID=2662447 RepID=A0A6L5Z3L4_9RHOB|nr:N-6 DNA methylase [Halovulum marinum]MSU90602.1 N-6 DNA methylase [Halovulum marinum]